MIKIENVEVFNFDGALRGLRNPKNSWHLSDSEWKYENIRDSKGTYLIGSKDLELAQRMVGAGTDESKFMRQIMVSIDIVAPLYWWKEFDTYKVGTVSNSCSTMHKLDSGPIKLSMFSTDGVDLNLSLHEDEFDTMDIGWLWKDIEFYCETLRKKYKETGNKDYWRALIQMLPNGWMQRRTITLNYQVLRAMYFARRHHKLTEWREFCLWIETLPYAKELICLENKNIKENENERREQNNRISNTRNRIKQTRK